MGNVVSFETRREVELLNGRLVSQPTSKTEYLFMCKDHLSTCDYEEVLLSIMDSEYYDDAERQIQAIVDTYFSFNK